jgi:hypothetical protein
MVQQAGLAPGTGIVAGDAERRRHKQILDRILVAAGALEADDMPDVGHLRGGFREQQGVDDWAAVCMKVRLPVTPDDRKMGAEPARIVAAAGKAEPRGDAVAALCDPRLARSRPPGEDAVTRPEDLACRSGVEIG